MKMLRPTLAIVVLFLPNLAFAQRGDLPRRVGECVNTTITSVETRLQGVADSGSAVNFDNGGYQVSYDAVPAIDQSKKGDPVRMCLVSIPRNCPKGDDRGREYRTTNLRTHQSWKLPNSEHGCGGGVRILTPARAAE